MAEVTVYDAERMKAIEDGTVVNGEIDVNGHLILTRFDGSEIDAGVVNPPPNPHFAKIAEVVLAAPANSIDFTAIPATYRHLQIVFQGFTTLGSTFTDFRLRLNGDTGSNYHDEVLVGWTTTPSTGSHVAANSIDIGGIVGSSPSLPVTQTDIMIANYRGPLKKTLRSVASHPIDPRITVSAGGWNNVAAITSIKLFMYASPSFNLGIGSMATLYGLL